MFSSSDEEIDQLIEEATPHGAPRRVFRPRINYSMDMDNQQFRESFRVNKDVAVFLEERLAMILEHETQRNMALSARQQLFTFLHTLGTSSFYHVMKVSHGPSNATVCRVMERVCNAILTLENEFLGWPADMMRVIHDFRQIANFPCVIGVVDGTHIRVSPPGSEETGYVNRHHFPSLNTLLVCGPDNSFYFCHSRCAGSWHDSRVMKDSTLWHAFEHGETPLPSGVILGDSAYACRSWLIPPFAGDVEGSKLRFNISHKKTRSLVERSIGLLKCRFYALMYGLRVRDMIHASNLTLIVLGWGRLCPQQL